jgi:hypothetical protein
MLAEKAGKEKVTETLEFKEKGTREKKKTKIDKDVTVVKSLEELKDMGKGEKVKESAAGSRQGILSAEGYKPETRDLRLEGKDRAKQHLDKIRKKGKGGLLKRVFRRKSI